MNFKSNFSVAVLLLEKWKFSDLYWKFRTFANSFRFSYIGGSEVNIGTANFFKKTVISISD